MPGIGPNKTTAAVSMISAAAAEPVTLASLWSQDRMLGKSLRFHGSGTFDVAGAYTNTLTLGADVTAGSQSSEVVVAASGAAAVASGAQTTGVFELDVDMACVTVGAATSGWIADGTIAYGVYLSTATQTVFTMGGLNVAGVATAVVLVPTTPYYFELWSLFNTAPTAFYLNKFKIYAEN
ncbi:MAG: hypothetical protein ABSG46_20235 [Candidatus Binataceae bacterium]